MQESRKRLTPVAAPELAQLFGVSAHTVYDPARRGIVVKAAPGRYDVESSTQRYCAHLRAMAARHGSEEAALDLAGEPARLAKEQADAHALRNASLRGTLVPAADVERRWSDVLRRVRSSMLAVSSRVRQRLPHLTSHDGTAIDDEIRAALTELGTGEPRS
jgi:phage terminase Nu1 subunit (DNA packaging protein)